MDPNARYNENKEQNPVNRKQPVGCKASTEVGNVGPLGYAFRRNERRKMNQDGKYLLAAKPERGLMTGARGSRYIQTRKSGSSAGSII